MNVLRAAIVLAAALLICSADRPDAVAEPVFEHLYVTGDIHGNAGVRRLLDLEGPGPRDAVIVLGDFGLLWDDGPAEKASIAALSRKPFTTLFVDGNHENFDLLAALPRKELMGGQVGKVNDRLFRLMRGEYYSVGERSIFVFGGGFSPDWKYRRAGKSWWAAEAPTEAEMANAVANLEKSGWKADFVLSHVPDMADQRAIAGVFGVEPDPDPTSIFLEEIKEKLEYGRWFCGHFHTDFPMNDKDRIVYDELLMLF